MKISLRQMMHRTVSFVLIEVLLFLVRIVFRPELVYASERAKQEAMKDPQVMICNHVRGWDGAVIYSLLRRNPMTVLTAKDKMEENWLMHLFLSLLPTLPIDRQHPSLSWLRESRKLLKNGKHIMIFPEGKCNFDGVTRPFKEGCVMLAAASGTKILPIYHNGVYHPFIGPRFKMIIGEPVEVLPPPEGMSSDMLKQETEQLLHTMQDLERQLTGTVRTLPKP